MRIQIFVFLNRSESDKQYYYLQLKENFLKYGFNYPDNRCFLLASYAIHSEETNWRAFDPREYFPAWVSTPDSHFITNSLLWAKTTIPDEHTTTGIA